MILSPDHILFDLDGTLFDTSLDLAAAISHTLENHNLPTHSVETVVSFIGNGSLNLMKRSLGPKNEDLAHDLHLEFLDYYLENCTIKSFAYPGVLELLAKPFSASIVTNKPEAPTLKILKAFGLQDRFDFILCGDTAPERKPSPAGIQFVLSQKGIRAHQALMVGDDIPDILAARAAQVPCVALLSGFGKANAIQEAQPNWIANDFSHFSKLVQL